MRMGLLYYLLSKSGARKFRTPLLSNDSTSTLDLVLSHVVLINDDPCGTFPAFR
jgi:hypothetical protein